jgi:hypothetical protein
VTLREAFKAGVEATKDAVINEMADNWEAWGQASTDERCYYVERLKVEPPQDLG